MLSMLCNSMLKSDMGMHAPYMGIHGSTWDLNVGSEIMDYKIRKSRKL